MSDIPEKRVHALISGRVQGVWYRASTRQEAIRLGLSGWVKNLPDGRVELVAEGPAQAVDALIKWCHKGPPYAAVDKVDVEEQAPTGKYDDFDLRF